MKKQRGVELTCTDSILEKCFRQLWCKAAIHSYLLLPRVFVDLQSQSQQNEPQHKSPPWRALWSSDLTQHLKTYCVPACDWCRICGGDYVVLVTVEWHERQVQIFPNHLFQEIKARNIKNTFKQRVRTGFLLLLEQLTHCVEEDLLKHELAKEEKKMDNIHLAAPKSKSTSLPAKRGISV